METDVLNEIQVRTECLMEMFEMVDSLTNNLLVLPSVSLKSMDSDDMSRQKTIRKLDVN
jgi:hypothetical protein